jgi:hypothetical protein
LAVLPSCAPLELAAVALRLLHASGAAEDALAATAPVVEARASSSRGRALPDGDEAAAAAAAAFAAAFAAAPPLPAESPRAYLLAFALQHLPLCTSAGPASLAALPSLRKALAAALAPAVHAGSSGAVASRFGGSGGGLAFLGACDDPIALPAALGQAASAASVFAGASSSSSSSSSGSGRASEAGFTGGVQASPEAAAAAATAPLLQRTLAAFSKEVARHARTFEAANAEDGDTDHSASRVLSRPCLVALFALAQCARLLLSLRPAAVRLHAFAQAARHATEPGWATGRAAFRLNADYSSSSGGCGGLGGGSSLLKAWDGVVAGAVDGLALSLFRHPGWALDEGLGAACCMARGGGLAPVWSPVAVLEAVVRLKGVFFKQSAYLQLADVNQGGLCVRVYGRL